ncbi:MAG: virulence factor [Acidimicrobiaceae bacterium]|nr:virulence factor [Acidimicrobiaceae bacterium]
MRSKKPSPVSPDTPRGRQVALRAQNNVKHSRARSNRRRSNSELVIIYWRDIPAQVNANVGDERIQRILPRRFQKAIDRAAMTAGMTQASKYVAEWRKVTVAVNPNNPQNLDNPQDAALTTAAELEDAFPLERLNQFVQAGGWNPDKPETRTASSSPTAADPMNH